MHGGIEESYSYVGTGASIESDVLYGILDSRESVERDIGIEGAFRDIYEEEVSGILWSSCCIIITSNKLVSTVKLFGMLLFFDSICLRLSSNDCIVVWGSLSGFTQITLEVVEVIRKFKKRIDISSTVRTTGQIGSFLRLKC